MFNINNRPGQFFQHHKRRMVNRTGSDLAIGDLLSIDMLGTATETAAGEGVGGITGLDVQDAIFHNAVLSAAANIDGIHVLVSGLLSGAGADDVEFEATLCAQRVQARVNGTVDVLIGDRLFNESGQTDLTKLTADVDAEDFKADAYALEARTDNSVGLMDVIFFGGMPYAAAGAGDSA